ncbi:MAG TPA: hypothetical protein VF599_22580 [Pyrinomonadaceae bacterium]
MIFSACLPISSNDSKSKNNTSAADSQKSADYKEPKVVGTIDSDEIPESSGLVNSPCQPDVLWTHNDSGDNAFVFALDRTGKKLATFKVGGAKNTDWEDLAIRKEPAGCFLYIGEIGNNARSRSEFTVYKVKEPTVSGETNSSKKNPLSTEAAEAIKFEYPDTRHDAETLLVHPATGDIYVLSKRLSGASAVYKLKAGFDSNKTNRLEKITDFTVPAIPNGLLTGGSISPDGKRVVVCDYFAAYEIVLPKQAKNFDEIWKQKPQKIELGQRAQGEAIAYAADGKAIYASSEEKDSPLIMVERK